MGLLKKAKKIRMGICEEKKHTERIDYLAKIIDFLATLDDEQLKILYNAMRGVSKQNG